MSSDLYAFLAERPTEPDEPRRRPGAGGEEQRPRPSTIYTASVETIDNDRATPLLGGISL